MHEQFKNDKYMNSYADMHLHDRKPFPKYFPLLKQQNLEDVEYSYFSSSSSNFRDDVTYLH